MVYFYMRALRVDYIVVDVDDFIEKVEADSNDVLWRER